MNRSRNSNSNNASGFVYFNINNSYQSNQSEARSDTSDFLSFGDTPSYGSPKFNRFSPSNYSSPQKFQNSPRHYNKRNNYRFSGGNYNRSFNNSNNSFNSSYNNNTRRRENNVHNKSFKSNNGQTDMSKYFDHTSLKDPWAELEDNLKKKREAKALENGDVIDSKEETSVAGNAESSSESEEEQETESESKSSSSGVDEETS